MEQPLSYGPRYSMNFSRGTVLWKLYADARVLADFAAHRLWSHLFSKWLFAGDDWVIGHTQPPSPFYGLENVDTTVEYFDAEARVLRLFLIFEKRGSRATAAEIAELESRTMQRCQAYIAATGREAVWVMTACGPRARIWLCQRSSVMPVFPSDYRMGLEELYYDVSEHSSLFRTHFGMMLRYPMPRSPAVGAVTDEYDYSALLRAATRQDIL
jgi:hypothetical protein